MKGKKKIILLIGMIVLIISCLVIIAKPSIESVAVSKKPIFKVSVNGPAEKFFLIEEQKTYVDLTVPWEGPGRVVSGDGYFVYRIPTEDQKKCIITFKMGNRFKVSSSKDFIHWNELLVAKDAKGLANFKEYTVDVSSMLPAEKIFLKFEDSQKAGFGCWFRELSVLSDRDEMRPKVSLDVYGENELFLSLNHVLNHHSSPKNPSEAKVSFQNNKLDIKVTCPYSRGYTPFSLTKTRDGEVYRDDCVEVFIAKADNPLDYRHFAINSIGTQYDELILDKTLNWKWQSNVYIDENFWRAEFLIDLGEIGLRVTEGDSILLCISRFDGDGKQIILTSPITGGLHQPNYWTKVVLGSHSEVLPVLNYNAKKKQLIYSNKNTSKKEKMFFLILDEENNAVLSNVVNESINYEKHFEFPKAGYYRAYSYSESGLVSVSSIILAQENINIFEAQAVAPIFYVGEIPRISYSFPEDSTDNRLELLLFSEGKLVNKIVKDRIENTKGVLNTLELPEGSYESQVNAYSGQTMICSVPIKFAVRKKTTTPCKIEISKSGFIMVDGEYFFPILGFLPQDLADIKSKGFNVVVSGNDNPKNPDWIEKNSTLLDEANKNGLKVLLHLCNLLRGENKDYESIKLVVSSFKNHPGLFGWYLADEPSANVPISRLEKAYKYIKAIDTNHPVVILDNVPAMLKYYSDYCDILGSDPYPVPSSPLELVKDWTEFTLKASRNSCILICLQGQGPPYYLRYPTFEEQKIMLNYALEGGAKAIGWWAHGTMRSSGYWEHWNELTTIAYTWFQKIPK